MEKKKKGKIVEYPQVILIVVVVAGIIVATIVCFWRIIVAPDWGQKLLAVSVLVPIWLGGFNMWKWLRSSSEIGEVSNRLDELVKVIEKKTVQTREIEEQRRKDARELPKIEVLNVKNSATSIELYVKNVGAEGKVTAFVENNSKFIVRWFELKGVVSEKEKKLARREECRVDISRKKVAVSGGKRITDWGSHLLKVHFPETDQIFKCKFRITEEGIKDFEFLGEEDE